MYSIETSLSLRFFFGDILCIFTYFCLKTKDSSGHYFYDEKFERVNLQRDLVMHFPRETKQEQTLFNDLRQGITI